MHYWSSVSKLIGIKKASYSCKGLKIKIINTNKQNEWKKCAINAFVILKHRNKKFENLKQKFRIKVATERRVTSKNIKKTQNNWKII